VTLYSYVPEVDDYVPSYDLDFTAEYYYYDQPSNTYSYYEPSPVVWSEYFETPEVELYSYEPSFETYEYVSEPSPYVSYYTYDVAT
jgi:hypothetical protein